MTEDSVKYLLKRLSENGFRLNKVKSLLNKTEVPFLGHVISVDGIKTNTKNVKDFLYAPRLVDGTEINSFLGMANYYSEIIPDFAALAEPLHKLTRKGGTFNWTSTCEKSFHVLNVATASDRCLVIYNLEFEMLLTTGASDVGLDVVISVVLLQSLQWKLNVMFMCGLVENV